jgi:hypothetical protein
MAFFETRLSSKPGFLRSLAFFDIDKPCGYTLYN